MKPGKHKHAIRSTANRHTWKAIIILFAICALVTTEGTTIDYCHSDPRMKLEPSLSRHPFHALLDSLWAMSFYLTSCVDPEYHTLTVAIPSQTLPTSASCAGIWNRVNWADCAAASLIAALPGGAKIVFHNSSECHERRVSLHNVPVLGNGLGLLGVQYNEHKHSRMERLPWYGRMCGTSTCAAGGDERERTTLVPLPDRYKYAAFGYLRSSFRSFLNISSTTTTQEEKERKIRVLLYDRKDAGRRKWVNAAEVMVRLRKDERVEVRMLDGSKRALIQQAKNYAWADVVLAAHGGSMANAVFMEAGTDLLEIWPRCDLNVAQLRFQPRPWTGAMTHFLRLHLTYIQCHYGAYKSDAQLKVSDDPSINQTSFRVRPDETMEYVDRAVRRQMYRLRHRAAMERDMKKEEEGEREEEGKRDEARYCVGCKVAQWFKKNTRQDWALDTVVSKHGMGNEWPFSFFLSAAVLLFAFSMCGVYRQLRTHGKKVDDGGRRRHLPRVQAEK